MAQQCSARAKSTGEQCARKAIEGGVTCRVHGSSTKAAKAAAAARREQAEAERAVVTLGVRRDISPADALLEEVQYTAGHVAWLRAKVQELEQDAVTVTTVDGDEPDGWDRNEGHPLVWGKTEHRRKTVGEDWGTTDVHKAEPSIWYRLYAEERKHLAAVCTAALKANIDARRLELAQRQGALLAQAVQAILADLNLTPEQQALVGTVVPMRLRAVAEGRVA